MNIFYTPDISGNYYTLEESESKHCIRVLRKSKGDRLILVDGRGGYYESVIQDPDPKRCMVEVTRETQQFEKRGYSLHLAVAPTKNIERFEWMIEKATEIGVDEITPLLCEHSERKQINSERLQKILVSAMKQSLKAYLPSLNNLSNFDAFLKNTQASGKYIAHCEVGEKKHLFNIAPKQGSVVVMIGPEGDFSSSEIVKALSFGYSGVSLGNSRLRTETAGMVACEIISLVNEG